jgi:hypothetical protein
MEKIRKYAGGIKEIFWKVETYWFFLIAGFLAFALLIWLYLIPYGVVEYNLGVNLFTSSLFTVLTVVFMNWLYSMRERIEWRFVEKEVRSDIQVCLGEIFEEILSIVENGEEIKTSVLRIMDSDTRKKAGLSQLIRLRESQEIKLEPKMLENVFRDKRYINEFSDISRRLGDIQIRYHRFLWPKLTVSLMRIQHSITLLELAFGMDQSSRKTELRAIFSEFRNLIPELVSHSFKSLINEIYSINEMGIELRYFVYTFPA